VGEREGSALEMKSRLRELASEVPHSKWDDDSSENWGANEKKRGES